MERGFFELEVLGVNINGWAWLVPCPAAGYNDGSHFIPDHKRPEKG